MEYALRGMDRLSSSCHRDCLNPCFNGICSARAMIDCIMEYVRVLILVLMEYALRAYLK